MTTLVIDIACMDCPQDAHGNYVEPDWRAARAAGVRGVYLRRSWTYFDHGHQAFRMCHDPVASWAGNARAAGLKVGFYLFPCFDRGAPSPTEQIWNFAGGPGVVVPGTDLPVCLDVEFPGSGIADTHLTQPAVLELVEQYVDGLTAMYHSAPAIYSSHVEVHDTNGLGLSPTAALPRLAACPLWQKTPYRVPAGQPLDQVQPAAPHDDYAVWDHADLWRTPSPWRGLGCFLQQFQGDVRGIPGVHQADASYFRVPEAWCRARLGSTTVLEFQAAHGLQADGIIGLMTFCAIAWA